MNPAALNVAYFIHLAHELTEDGVQRTFDHLVFFNGHTKYVLSKAKFQDLNTCNLADLEGGTPFVIDDKSINAEVDVHQDYTMIYTLLKFYKEDEKHSPKLLFQVSPSDRWTQENQRIHANYARTKPGCQAPSHHLNAVLRPSPNSEGG